MKTVFFHGVGRGNSGCIYRPAGSICRVYTYRPIRERGSRHSTDLTPILITYWKDTAAPTDNSNVTSIAFQSPWRKG